MNREAAEGSAPSPPIPDDLGLVSWQLEAVEAWVSGDAAGPFRGTVEVFTGGGKSLIALACMRRALAVDPSVRFVIVVPTLALLRQWRTLVLNRTFIPESHIGELHGQRKDRLEDCTVLLAVLNSASEWLPSMSRDTSSGVMLIVDESHRAGAPQFSRVLDTRAEFRLGLSATAAREDVDEEGIPVEYDDHALGVLLGQIVYRFDLRMAREIGWLPEFTVYHHRIHLMPDERRVYDDLSRRIDDLADRLADEGLDVGSARRQVGQSGSKGDLSRAYVGAVAQRKDLLYRAAQRQEVAVRILNDLAVRQPPPRVLLFHERIDEAADLHRAIEAQELPVDTALEHSRLPDAERQLALACFSSGQVSILVSVKSLIEGIDVPDADVGMSIASSSSVRQRIQALGRVLRRRFDGGKKTAEMHLLYVGDSVDEAIYEKEDWGDLTGEARNIYLDWHPGAQVPVPLPGPPRTPRPTEEQFWESIGGDIGEAPIPWPCEWPRNEWRLDSRGTITNLEGRLVVNPQTAVQNVRLIKPGGGRFRVSHKYRCIVVPETIAGNTTAWLVGRLEEPFRFSHQANEESETSESSSLEGEHFPGPLDRSGGSFQIRQKSGGVVERRGPGGREFAATDPLDDPRRQNARRVLEAWQRTGLPGIKFFVNSNGDAYHLDAGVPRFLASVPEGFDWPGAEEGV